MGLCEEQGDKNLWFSFHNSTGIQGTVTYSGCQLCLSVPMTFQNLLFWAICNDFSKYSSGISDSLLYRNSSLRQRWEGTAGLPGVRQQSDEVQGIILELITHFCTMGNTNLLCLKPVWRKFLAAKGKRNMILLYKNSWQYYTKNSPKFRHFRLNPA